MPVDAMGDESQVLSKATRHSSTAQICHALSREWCCLLLGAVALNVVDGCCMPCALLLLLLSLGHDLAAKKEKKTYA